MVSYAEITRFIKVTVRPFYLDEQSNMLDKRFVFGYHVRIENQGSEEVQLLRRKWEVRDNSGRVREVEGEGVIGRQPVIPAGDTHSYSSYSVLESFEGTMEGSYLMQLPNGERFQVEIPLFFLVAAAN
jgi:ApaG protein